MPRGTGLIEAASGCAERSGSRRVARLSVAVRPLPAGHQRGEPCGDENIERVLALMNHVLDRPNLFDIECERILSGGQARLYIVRARDDRGGDQRFVIKDFLKDNELNSKESIEVQFKALRLLSGLFIDSKKHASPTPIYLTEDGWTFIYTFSNGRNLEEYILLNPQDWKEICDGIVEGLYKYYGSSDDIYGEFSVSNMLIDQDRRVVFLDPTFPDPFYKSLLRMVGDPAVVDFGYWVFSISSRLVKLSVLDPRKAYAFWRFSRLLLARAAHQLSAGDRLPFLRAVDTVAAMMLRRMRATGPLKWLVLHPIGRIVAYRLLKGLDDGAGVHAMPRRPR